MRDLNPKVAADGQSTSGCQCLFLHLLILSAVFHIFLKINTWNKKYKYKNEYTYPFCQFEENPPIFTNLSWRPLFWFIFHSKFHCTDLFFSNSSCCEWRPCAKKFGDDRTCQHISSCCLGFSLIKMFGFCGSADLSGCSGRRVHTQSVGEERNAYKCLFLCLVQCEMTGKCPSYPCKDFFLTLEM